ncbi:hypothetical protein [Nostoc sp.]|uniref:hypothetical protein n=1 Tax=Nostoc sp. TaxID=1180 RepID=UPI002FF8C601
MGQDPQTPALHPTAHQSSPKEIIVLPLQAYKKEEVVYVDEAGTDNTEDYAYGWCNRRERFEADKLGHCTSRISMISAWCDHLRWAVTPSPNTCANDIYWILRYSLSRSLG